MTVVASEPEAAGFRQWAILELMGHRQRVGLVEEVELAGAKMLRIDIPTEPAEVTEFYSPAAVYGIRVVSEAIARQRAQELGDIRPPMPVEYRPRLPGPGDDQDDERQPF